MNITVKNVPKLRFKEFSGEWISTPFNEIAEIRKGKFDPSKNKSLIKCIELEHLSQNTGEIIGYIGSDSIHSIKNIFKKGDVLFGKLRPNLRKFALASFDGICSSEIWGLFSKIVNNKYLFQLIQTNKFYEESIVSSGTKMPRADWNHISCCCFYISTEKPEQQKIADFLTSVDNKIQALKQQQQLLLQYKKGMMQKLFSQQVRFKDENGLDYPEWEEYKFNELYSFIKTNSLSRENLTYEFGIVKNIHYGDIHTKYKSHYDATQENSPYLKSSIDINKISDEEYCKVGDLIIADASEDYKDIGKTIEIVKLGEHSLVSGLHTFIARPTKNQIVGFGGFLMQTDGIRKQIQKLATGISVLGISKNNMIKLTCSLPSLPEQQKIADCLSAIDQKIELVNKKISYTEQFKQGLLQQLFV